MKQKFLTLMTLLLTVCSGAWAQTTLLSADFSSCNGTGGRDGVYTGATTGLSKVTTDNLESICGTGIASTDNNYTWIAKECVYFSSSSKKMKTKDFAPSLFTDGKGLLTFSMAGKTGSSCSIKITVTGASFCDTENGSYKVSGKNISISATSGSWTNHTIYLKDIAEGTNVNIEFACSTIYLDDILLTTETVSGTTLDAPEISATESGSVTIGAVTNATKVTYTTDGTDPTAESTEYTAAFDVADGTTVKAIAIGDGESYNNSTVATKVVYYTGITVATPVIKTYNGSVGITCATPGATIKYSIDGGTTYSDYARTFTLSADATVKAYAVRTDCTNSAEANAAATVVSNGWNSTVYLPLSLFDVGQRDGTTVNNLLTGKTGTVAEGYSIAITGRDDKAIISGSTQIGR